MEAYPLKFLFMIPYILAGIGGYLIGDAYRKKYNPLSNPYNILKDGGMTSDWKLLDAGDGVEYEIWSKEGVKYRVPIEREDDLESGEPNINRYFDQAEKYAKGGETKWIQEAIKKPGALRAEAKRQGLIKGDEKLSKADLDKLEKEGGKTAQRARKAKTLRKLK